MYNNRHVKNWSKILQLLDNLFKNCPELFVNLFSTGLCISEQTVLNLEKF